MPKQRISRLALVMVVVAFWPSFTPADSLAVVLVQDRVYRAGVVLVVDALAQNQSPHRLDRAEVPVEFYNFFDQLISVGHTVLRPFSLGPGQLATLEVVMLVPSVNDPARKVRYRFTWQQNGEQVQAVVTRTIWAIGRATSDP